MKVQYFANIPSPYRVSFFCELAKYVDLTVVYERRNASDRDKKWVGNNVINHKEVFIDARPLGTDNSFGMDAFKYVDLSADIIVIGMYSTYTAMLLQMYLRFHKKPYFLNSDGGFIRQENWLKKGVKRFFISKASWWLSTGKMTTNYFEYYGAKRENIFEYPFSSVYQNKLEINENYDKNELKKEIGIPTKRLVLSVGQFIYRKGYDLLIKAASELPRDITWIIIGGEITSEYENLIKQYNLNNIQFLSFMKPEDVFSYYRAADLFVLPTREDIWGLVINEAAACGLPIVTTNRCIAGDEMIIDGKNGYICIADDVRDLKRKLEMALSEDFCDRFSRADVLSIASQYTIENMAKKHYEIFMNAKV